MNRRTLLSRALALLGGGAAAASLPAAAAVPAAAATWTDLRGGMFWVHQDGWSWMHAEQTIIADDEHFHDNVLAWVIGYARKSFNIIGVDLRTYDILVRRNMVDKMGSFNLMLGKQIRVVHIDARAAHDIARKRTKPGFLYGSDGDHDFSWSV